MTKKKKKGEKVCKLKYSVGKIQDLFTLKKFVVSAKKQHMGFIWIAILLYKTNHFIFSSFMQK